MICRDSRNMTEPCHSLKGDQCRALRDTLNPCPFYKPRSVRVKELRELARRIGDKYGI